MCPYQAIAALQLGPNALDAAGLMLILLAYAWRVLDQAAGGGRSSALAGSRARV